MNRFADIVADTIARRGLPRPPARLVVAVSGGADSVALLSVLVALGYDCVAAHCNFHLRGAESVRDMHSVERLTEALGIDLCIRDFDVEAQRRESGESVEMACRTLRYRWFADLLEREHARAIAVGHHREDRLETFFINTIRGSGIKGLPAMKARNGYIIRPLIDTTRGQIEEYLRGLGLDWVDDSTNESDDFLRNRVRHHLLPALDAVSPGAADGILRTLDHLDENSRVYSRGVEALMAPYSHGGEIDLAALSSDPDAGLLLFETLAAEGFNRTQTDDMLAAAQRSGGLFHASAGHLREVDHGILRPARASAIATADAVEVSLARHIQEPVEIAVSLHDVAGFSPERRADVMYLDAAVLNEAHHWVLRHPRRGDRMTPFGLDGSRLLSDIFAEARLSRLGKQRAWLLTCDGTVVWAVGLRPGNFATVGPGTQRYLRLQLVGSTPQAR